AAPGHGGGDALRAARRARVRQRVRGGRMAVPLPDGDVAPDGAAAGQVSARDRSRARRAHSPALRRPARRSGCRDAPLTPGLRPVHVAFLTCEYPPLPSGGIGTSVRTLARALAAAGHRVTVLGWGHDARFDDEGVRVVMQPAARVPKSGWLANRLRAHRTLSALVEHEGLDIVEAPDWCGPSAGVRPPCPVVIRCHGSALYFARLLGERVSRRAAAAEWLALRQAAAIVAVSRFTASETRRLFRLTRPIGTIPNGIDLRR